MGFLELLLSSSLLSSSTSSPASSLLLNDYSAFYSNHCIIEPFIVIIKIQLWRKTIYNKQFYDTVVKVKSKICCIENKLKAEKSLKLE